MVNGTSVIVVCAYCGTSFRAGASKKRKYCSITCGRKHLATAERMSAMRSQRKINFSGIPGPQLCRICGTGYQPVSARQKWCATCMPDDNARARYRRYGLTEPQWLEMVARHGGKCWICKRREAVCVDHDHATGAIRGALCHKCNQSLGFIEAPEWFAAARSYLGWSDDDGQGQAPRRQPSPTSVSIFDR